MSDSSVRELERSLRAVGRDIRYPETPPMSAAVIERVRRVPVHTRRSFLPRPRYALGVAATIAVGLIATVVFSPGAREAVADWLGVDGIRIIFDDEQTVRSFGDELDLGEPATLAQAEDVADFDLATPTELGPPDGVFVRSQIPGGEVSFVWRASAGLPESEQTGAGAVLTQFIGSADPVFFKKIALTDTDVTRVVVDGREGFFIEGAPHVIVRTDDGERTIPLRLAGNTLIWDGGEVTYRLEAAVELPDALRIARSMD